MNKYREILSRYGLENDREGIYAYYKLEKYYITNFPRIDFLYSIRDVENNAYIRRIQIGVIKFDLQVEQLLSLKSFNKTLLSKSKYLFKGSTKDFDNFIQIILALDNNKIVIAMSGFGNVGEDMYNLGNIIYTENTIYPFKELIWSGDKGHFLTKTNRIHISKNGWNPSEIFDKFTNIFGKISIIIMGYVTAGIFYKPILQQRSSFPILYLLGSSGIGKSTFSELILGLNGIDRSWATVNCDSNSTKIGIDEKTQQFNSIPLVLNELDRGYYPMLKSRYDGHGAVRASSRKNQRTAERKVKGPTIAISVALPDDIQVSSRSIIIDYENVKRDKLAFDQLHREINKLSVFVLKVIQKITVEDVISHSEEFKMTYADARLRSRILESYSIIAGAMVALISVYPKINLTKNEIYDYCNLQMIKAEEFSDPLFPFVNRVKSILLGKESSLYTIYDEQFIYLNLPGLWKELKKGFKDKYFNGKGHSYIKTLLMESDYLARYDVDFRSKRLGVKGQQVISHEKKINKTNYRCLVLVKKKFLTV